MAFMDVNGVSLRYDVQGAGKPIVLIHEMGGTLESWGLVAPLLASHAQGRFATTRAAWVSRRRSAAPSRSTR